MGRRLHAFSLVMCLLFTVVCGRVLYVARSGDFAVGQSYNSYTLLFEQNDTEITDRLGRSMGGTRKEWVAVIRPTRIACENSRACLRPEMCSALQRNCKKAIRCWSR